MLTKKFAGLVEQHWWLGRARQVNQAAERLSGVSGIGIKGDKSRRPRTFVSGRVVLLLVAGFLVGGHHPTPTSASTCVTTQITISADRESFGAAISADGTRIAFGEHAT